MMKVSIGRIVHYVMPDGQHRPGIVVHVWSETAVNLQVFQDGVNDGAHPSTMQLWKTSVGLDESAKNKNTWHWPEREEDQPTNVAQRAHEPIAEASAQTVAPAGVESGETVGAL